MLYLTAPATGTQLMTLVPSPPPPGTSVVGSSVGTSRASRASTAGRNVRRLPFLVDSNNVFSVARPFTATSPCWNPADPWATAWPVIDMILSRLEQLDHDVFSSPNTQLSRGGRAERQETPPNQYRGRRRLQRLDTYHGLAWGGPGPVPRVY